MAKYTKIFIFILIAFVSISISCSKYEDGPKISLISKKSRISKEWKTEYSVNLATGIEHSADYYGWLLSINKAGTFSKVINYNLIQTTYNGTWEFVGDNQLRFNFNTATGEQIEFYTILRLSRKELWVKNECEEIHYYSD
ncbi:MAG: hypothetical protein ABFS35_05045 [Bacteroidota bacterium]